MIDSKTAKLWGEEPAQPTPPDLSKLKFRKYPGKPKQLIWRNDRVGSYKWMLLYEDHEAKLQFKILTDKLEDFSGQKGDFDLVPIEEPKPEPRSWDGYAFVNESVSTPVTAIVGDGWAKLPGWIRVRITEVLE